MRPLLPVLLMALLGCASPSEHAVEPEALASWNDGAAKQAIVEFVRVTTDSASDAFVPAEERIAVFDQDGTLWVEQPMYAQVMYVLSRVPAVVAAKPSLAKVEPYKTVLSGDPAKIAKLSLKDLETLLAATLTGVTVEDFQAQVQAWLDSAHDPRWQQPYTNLKDAKLILNDDKAGKVQGIHLMIGRRPVAAFGNSAGDKEMLEYTKSGGNTRLAMIVLHDDKEREYAYGPAKGLPASKVGTFPQALYDQAQKQGWIVISMKNDWNRIFAFEGEGDVAREAE